MCTWLTVIHFPGKNNRINIKYWYRLLFDRVATWGQIFVKIMCLHLRLSGQRVWKTHLESMIFSPPFRISPLGKNRKTGAIQGLWGRIVLSGPWRPLWLRWPPAWRGSQTSSSGLARAAHRRKVAAVSSSCWNRLPTPLMTTAGKTKQSLNHPLKTTEKKMLDWIRGLYSPLCQRLKK